jgi:hypothetical protein
MDLPQEESDAANVEAEPQDLDEQLAAVACSCVAYYDDQRVVGDLAHASRWARPG